MNENSFTIDQATEENLHSLLKYLNYVSPDSGALAVVEDFLSGARCPSFEHVLEAMDWWIAYESKDSVL